MTMICWQNINKSCNYIIITLMLALTCSVDRLGSKVFQNGENPCWFFTQTAADCSGRGLLEVPKNLPENLEYLDLSNNEITGLTSLDFNNLTKLRKLKLNNNKITNINGSVLSRSRDLEYLDLSANDLTILQNDAFSGLTNLKTLLLNENELISIKENPFKDLASLRRMSINSKKLLCSCEIIWLSKWLKKQISYTKDALNVEQVTCYEQISQKHTKLTQFAGRYDVILSCNKFLKPRRTRRSAKSTHWSCAAMSNGNVKVVPLDAVSTATSDVNICMVQCNTAGKTYGTVSGTNCLCGDMKSKKYNAGSGCKVSCPGSASSCLPYISPNDLIVVKDYLAALQLTTSSSSVHTSSSSRSPFLSTSSTSPFSSSSSKNPFSSSSSKSPFLSTSATGPSSLTSSKNPFSSSSSKSPFSSSSSTSPFLSTSATGPSSLTSSKNPFSSSSSKSPFLSSSSKSPFSSSSSTSPFLSTSSKSPSSLTSSTSPFSSSSSKSPFSSSSSTNPSSLTSFTNPSSLKSSTNPFSSSSSTSPFLSTSSKSPSSLTSSTSPFSSSSSKSPFSSSSSTSPFLSTSATGPSSLTSSTNPFSSSSSTSRFLSTSARGPSSLTSSTNPSSLTSSTNPSSLTSSSNPFLSTSSTSPSSLTSSTNPSSLTSSTNPFLSTSSTSHSSLTSSTSSSSLTSPKNPFLSSSSTNPTSVNPDSRSNYGVKTAEIYTVSASEDGRKAIPTASPITTVSIERASETLIPDPVTTSVETQDVSIQEDNSETPHSTTESGYTISISFAESSTDFASSVSSETLHRRTGDPSSESVGTVLDSEETDRSSYVTNYVISLTSFEDLADTGKTSAALSEASMETVSSDQTSARTEYVERTSENLISILVTTLRTYDSSAEENNSGNPSSSKDNILDSTSNALSFPKASMQSLVSSENVSSTATTTIKKASTFMSSSVFSPATSISSDSSTKSNAFQIDIKTAFNPTKSSSVPSIIMTEAKPETPYVIERHRTARDISSSSSSMATSSSSVITQVLSSHGFKMTTSESKTTNSALSEVSVILSYDNNGRQNSLLFKKTNEELQVQQSGINIIDHNTTIAVPSGIQIDFTIVAYHGNKDTFSVAFSYDNITETRAMLKCKEAKTYLCNSNQSRVSSFSANFTEETSKNLSMLIEGQGTSSAKVFLNLTILKVVQTAPDMITNKIAYIAKSESFLSAFKTTYKQVEATLKIINEGNQVVFQNQSVCASNCPAPLSSDSNCLNSSSDTCFLWIEYSVDKPGIFNLTIEFSNPVTAAPVTLTFPIVVETRISSLSIASCDYFANVNESKSLTVKFQGDSASIMWYLDGQPQKRQSDTFNYTFKTTGTRNVSVEVSNNINNMIETKTITVLQSGSVHGLSIIRPKSNSYFATDKELTLEARLCEGEDPELEWNFDDGTNFTTNSTVAKHSFKYPRSYRIKVTARNFANKTEQTSIQLNIQDEIKNFTAYSSKTIVKLKEIFYIYVSVMEGTDVAYSVRENGTKNLSERQKKKLSFSTNNSAELSISTSGTFSYTVSAKNGVSEMGSTVTVTAQEIISIALSDSLYIQMGRNVTVAARKSTGTHMFTKWDFGDNTQIGWIYDSSPSITHVYQNEGRYHLTLAAMNNVSSVVESAVVLVQRPLDTERNRFSVKANNYVATNESIYVNISVEQTSIYGYNVSGAADFLLPNNTRIISKVFDTAGTYILNFFASNQVSNVSASVVVIAQDRITGEVKLYPLYVPLNKLQTLNASIQGTEPVFNFSFSNGEKTTGETVQHTFTDLGPSIVNVTARNKVSEVSAKLIVNVEFLINNLTLSSNATVAALKSAVMFRASLRYRLEHVYTWNVSSMRLNNSADTLVWKFSDLGMHWVSVKVENHLGSDAASMSIEVQEPISGLRISTATTNKELSILPFNESVTLFASVAAGSNITYSWTSDLPIKSSIVSDSFHVLVSDPGIYYVNVSLKAYNKLSSNYITLKFPVIQRISDVMLSANTTNTIPNDTVRIWPTFSTGTNISMTWLIDGVCSSHANSLDCVFPKAATYNITVILSNALGSRQTSLTIIVQDLISFVRMYPTVTATNRTTEFHVTAIRGTDPDFKWKIPTGVLASNLDGSFSKTNLTFPHSSIYTLIITTSNLVHNINTSFAIKVEDEISGLEILHSKIFYPTQKFVNLNASTSKGSDVQYDWLFKLANVTHKYRNARTVSHVFVTAGGYDVIVKASNRVSWMEESVKLYAQDVAVVSSLHSDHGNVLPTQETVSLTAALSGTNLTTEFILTGNLRNITKGFNTVELTITRVGHINVTVKASNKVSSTEKTVIFQAQDRITGLSLWASSFNIPTGSTIRFKVFRKSGTSVSYKWKVNGTLVQNGSETIERSFPTTGIYDVTVTAINGLRSAVSSVIVKVEGTLCQPPTISILGGKKRELYQSQWLYTEALVEYNCSSSSVSSSWEVKNAKKETNCIFEQQKLERFKFSAAYLSDVSLDCPLLGIPPDALSLGHYCMIYTAAFGQDGRFKVVDAINLKVLQLPPEPIILGGPSRTVGLNQSFMLEAASGSSASLPLDLLYKWTCVAKPLNNSDVIIASGCNNRTWSAENKIQVQPGTLDVKASYEFRLSVKRHREKPVYATQKIYVIHGKVAEVFIECVTCKVYKSLKYVRNRALKITGKCNNCFENGKTLLMEYKWQIIASNGTVLDYPLRNSTESMDVLVIRENKFDGVSTYEIRLTVRVIGDMFKNGESTLSLSPNLPPRNGSCDLTPSSGQSLQTSFSYLCQNWQDEDNVHVPFIYWLVVINWDLSRDILYRGIKSKRSFYLPIGDKVHNNALRLQVLVEDILGAVSIGIQRNVFVYPPITNNVATFLEDKVLPSMSLLIQENDLSKVVTASQATTKLLTGKSSIGLKEQAIISNVTGYTSKMSASTLESIEQLSTTLKFSISLLPENAVTQKTRQDLTKSLSNMVSKVNSWAERGLLGSDSSLQALLFLAQNNIAADGLVAKIDGLRQRREISESISGLKTNLNLVMQIYTSILRESLRGEGAKRYSTKYGTAILERSSASTLSRAVTADGCSFEMQNFDPLFSDVFKIFNSSFLNPYAGLSGIASKIAGLSYSLPNGTDIPVKNMPLNKSILIKLETTKPTAYSILTKLINPNSFADGELTIGMPLANNSLMRVDFVVISGKAKNVDVYIKPGQKPTDLDSLYRLHREKSSNRSNVYSRVYTPGEFSSSVKQFIRIRNRDKEQKLNISIIAYAVSCQFWDRQKKTWDTYGCQPTNESNLYRTICRCNHLTSFASAFKIAPNPIKWSTLSELDIERNPIAVSACLVLIVLYLVSLFFASRKDEEDRTEAQFIPLLGSDEYFKYEVRIKTGIFPGAGTTANVGIKIFGTKCTTKSIVLTKEGSFQRNSIDLFRFASVTRLGKIVRVQVWHNNAGSSPSWYLSRIVIKNILSGEKFFFFCNSWMAVDRGDGQIDRHFDVADEKMMAKFTTIFNDVVGRTFTDYHLWISLFEKPKMSRFTRVQRVTCCATFLLSWMCVDAMWFGTAQAKTIDLYLGFKGYSYEEVIVGVISSLMVFPINMIFVLIFRKSRTPQSRQILDGEEEVTIHILPSHRRARRLSEDWIEIEDSRPSGAPKFATSLPRCGGVMGLNSYQPMMAVHELPLDNSLIDLEAEEEEMQQSTNDINTSRVTYAIQQSRESTYIHARESNDAFEAKEEPTLTTRFSRFNSKQYTRIPFPSLQEEDEDMRDSINEQESSDLKPILPNRFSKNDMEPRKWSFSEQHLVSLVNDFKRRSSSGLESASNQIKYQDFSDSFNSSKQSSHFTNSSLARTFSDPRLQSQKLRNTYRRDSSDIPDIREYHSSLECLLPSWFTVVGYFGCLAVSVLSFVVILIYGQQFGKEKATKWIASLFSGLVQDIFVTYPVLLVVVAVVVALIRRPMNLDYSDFVMCPVVPGDCNITSEPLRGYALEIAQRQGRNKRKLRKLLKKCFFQFIHLWMVLSICLTSYESNMATVKKNFESRLASGSSGFDSVNSIGQLWQWTENTLPKFLYPDKQEANNWHLKSVPRIRQIRVRSSACIPVTPAVETITLNRTCTPDYEDSRQETRDFSRGWKLNGASKAIPWKYIAEKDLNGTDVLGEFSSYPHSGYIAYLASTRFDSLNIFRSLKAAGWLDVNTRAVFIEFTMHNVNINKYAVVTISFEISTTGMILRSLEVLYARIHMYTRNIDYFRLFCEVIFGLLTFYLFWHLIHRITKHQWKIFCKFWDVHLMLVCLVSATIIALYIYRLIIFLDIRPYLKTGVPQGYDLRHEAIIDWAAKACMGFLCFLVIFKVITLLSISSTYDIIGRTLRSSSRHIVTLFIGFSIVLVAFSSWGYLAFGSESYIFHSFWRSLAYTCLIRNWKVKDSGIADASRGQFIVWNIFYVTILLAFVAPFFRAALCAAYKDGKSKFLSNRRRHRDFSNYLFKVISRKKPLQKKRVKFSMNESTRRRSTIAGSQQTISLGSDPGIPGGHMPWSHHRMPPALRERLLNRLNPRTDEILAYVYQLEQDEYLEEEFFSRLESMTKNLDISDKQL